MTTTPILILRADANPAIGLGHVMRCLALAQAWRDDGGRALFCGRIESEFLARHLATENFEVLESGAEPGQTLEALDRHGLADAWVALDGYHFGVEWQEVLVAAGHRVLVLDDGARLPRYPAQAILAPEHDARPSCYDAPASTVILAGPRYRLLRSGFLGTPRTPSVRRDGVVVLVCFGGADSRNATCAALTGLGRVLGSADRVLVVLGPLNPHEESIIGMLGRSGFQHELHRAVDDMSSLYRRADLAISAAGGAAWELAVCGLPAILVPVADNQFPGMRYLAAAGAALAIDGVPSLLGDEFPRQVGELLANPEALRNMARRGRAVCDGRGAWRVCRVLRCLDQTRDDQDFVVRPAQADDMEQVYRLANDRTVRDNSFSPKAIALADHVAWFGERISSPATAFYVMEFEGILAAVARFDAARGGAETDVAVHPAFRGRGLGARMLRECAAPAAARLKVSSLRAVVFERNVASRRSFLRGGFREAGKQMLNGRDCAIYEWQALRKGAHFG